MCQFQLWVKITSFELDYSQELSIIFEWVPGIHITKVNEYDTQGEVKEAVS
jgi:hypothetical protein